MAACNADRLLDDSFRTQTEMLLSALPQRRQTLAFSATFTPVRTYLSAHESSMRRSGHCAARCTL
jgi:superfamily II DNA/RNA helicase